MTGPARSDLFDLIPTEETMMADVAILTPSAAPTAVPASGDTKPDLRSAVGSTPTPARTSPELPHTCGRCHTRWAGNRTAHCGACHETFGGVSGFDRHRRNGPSRDPASIGMSLLPARQYPCWGCPEDGAA